jgi:hypothetical protein
MSSKRLLLALLALGMLAVPGVAQATHPISSFTAGTKVNNADVNYIRLVPAQKKCGGVLPPESGQAGKGVDGNGAPETSGLRSANATHGAPLSFQSCFRSDETTLKTSRLTTGAGYNASIIVKVKCTNGGNYVDCGAAGDQADVALTAFGSDIRCKPTYASGHASVCAPANSDPTRPDYVGQVLGNSFIRITDHYNTTLDPTPACNTAADPNGCSATVTDSTFPVGTQCTATASTAVGANCNIATSADAVIPDVVKENKRSSVEIDQIIVLDGGDTGTMPGGTIAPGVGGVCPPSCLKKSDQSIASVSGILIP